MVNMEVSIYGGTPKWMVYSGKSKTKMDEKWGTPTLGNFHIYPYITICQLAMVILAPR
jgi:hypothetical protein